MTIDREDIIRMAQEAAKQHGHTIKPTDEIVETLTSFAALVAKAAIQDDLLWQAETETAVLGEREACAKVCDSRRYDTTMLMSNPPQSAAAFGAAQAIRARKENT